MTYGNDKFTTSDFFRPFFGIGGLFDELMNNVDNNSFVPFGRAVTSRDDEGNAVVEYNLAGFDKDQIQVGFDKSLKVVNISASDGERKNFSASFNVGPYVKEKDFTVSYENGILRFVIRQVSDEDKKSSVKSLTVN